MRVSTVVSGALIAVAAIACGTLSSNEQDTETPGPSAPPGQQPPGAPPPVSTCTSKIIYVAGATGDDAHDGCTKDAPKRTIGNALAVLGTEPGFEIWVCRGTYTEPSLRLDRPASLRGGYDCATWTRTPGFGKANGFDATNEVVIANGAYSARNSTFEITGAAIGHDQVVEGFTFLGFEGGASGGTALAITNNAAPTVTDVRALGGATKLVPGIGSVGIAIASGAAPIVKDSDIRGGGGTSSGVGSVGSIAVFVDHASGAILANAIDAGSGHAETGGIGIKVSTPSAPVQISGNWVAWANELTTIGAGYGGTGIDVADGAAEISYNNVVTGVAACETTPCGAFGVRLTQTTGSLRDNVIYGPTLRNKSTPLYDSIFAVSIANAGALEIAGNVVIAGTATSTASGVVGFDLHAGGPLAVAGNTVVTAEGPAPGSRIAIRLAAGATASFDGNIVVGAGDTGDVAFADYRCGSTNTVQLTKNVVVAGLLLRQFNGSDPNNCNIATDYSTEAAAQPKYPGSAGNLRVSATCLGDPACTGCASTPACQKLVFPGFVGRDVTTMRLTSATPCAIANMNPTLPLSLTVDVFDVKRTAPFSAGASESDICGQ